MSKKSKKTVYVTTQLPPKYKKLAAKAGFALWSGESWAPPNACIDWASLYDKEMKLYTELLIKKCFKAAQECIDNNDNWNAQLDALWDAKEEFLKGFDKLKQDKEDAEE